MDSGDTAGNRDSLRIHQHGDEVYWTEDLHPSLHTHRPCLEQRTDPVDGGSGMVDFKTSAELVGEREAERLYR